MAESGAARMGREMEALESARNEEMWAEFPDAPAPPSNDEVLSEMLDKSYEAGFMHGYRKRAELDGSPAPQERESGDV